MWAAQFRAAIYTSPGARTATAVCSATFVWTRIDAHFMSEIVAMTSAMAAIMVDIRKVHHDSGNHIRKVEETSGNIFGFC